MFRSHRETLIRPTIQRITALAVLVGCSFAVTQPAHADNVDDKRKRVEQVVSQLDALDDKISQTNEDYLSAVVKSDQLDKDIAALQVQVDAEAGRLGELVALLEKLAIDRYTTHGSGAENPLLTNQQTFAEDQQRQELTNVAINAGVVDTDNVQAAVDELTQRRTTLDSKKKEAAQLVSYLDGRNKQLEQMSKDYAAQRVKAEAELGAAIKQEEERRAQEQIAAANKRQQQIEARAAAQQQAAAAPAAAPARGGGASAPSAAPSAPSSPAAPQAPKPPKPEPAAEPTNYPAPAGNAGIAVNAARGQLGVPYRYASSSPGVAFDCSGLTAYAWSRAGVYLPHQSAQQYAATPHVPESAAQPGDLIFYYSPISHVGIYIGGGAMIHAPRTGDVVKVTGVNWSKTVGVSRPG